MSDDNGFKIFKRADGSSTVVTPRYGKNSDIELRDFVGSMPNNKAQLAIHLASHFGIVSCKFDGFDEAGRQKMALLEPNEIVERSMDIASKLYDEIEKAGWMLPGLPVDDLYGMKQE